MRIPRLAYIVQLDLPGRPIKIGCTKNPWTRFDAFSHGTPVSLRYVGLTIDGFAREKEMLAATAATKIKGEWRYPTPELARAVLGYHLAREWFVYDPSSYDADEIRSRVLAITPDAHRYLGKKIGPRSVGYAWANDVLRKATSADPLLSVHWAGFREAKERPSFLWPDSPLSIAEAA